MRSAFRVDSPPHVATLLDQALPRLRAEPFGSPDSWPLASALLLCGDFDAVRAMLADAPPHAALPLLAARYHAWTGDLHLVMALFHRVRASLPLLESDTVLRRMTWPELERLATDVGDPVLAAQLVRRAREEPHSAGDTGDDPAGTVSAALHHLLGPEPDAHRGRLRLRPRIADHEEIRMSDLRFADGAVSLTVRQQGDRIEYSVVQEAGAMPFTVLLEPVIARAVRAAEVDGREARLDARPHEEGFIAPVQLVLDERRSLALELEPE